MIILKLWESHNLNNTIKKKQQELISQLKENQVALTAGLEGNRPEIQQQLIEPQAGTSKETKPQAGTSEEIIEPQAGTSIETIEPQAGTSKETIEPQAGTSKETIEPQGGTSKETIEPPIETPEEKTKHKKKI